ncbi:demethylmenaquinone methyltransferase/2-methoxy-6-polyprenyl-1,4-benzoquinol methylase [Dysgonomonas sp. PH5-45]|uniref:bifunctional demethylmenaquinone methyltransferase/2-methoxy-6-polyprenyl-1,4-benzoquinol methylase UbiE n=1 Tax=unclassified Dysgonomonas TaxID=2630389 RepID=UPI00247410BD|nr:MULTISPECIES: bifunctional demethylmenaquinone methyltransferase/2-methoxy-6-polyprenyl-1,4-benzoquinol methylase UbiE [unclassified Dysgonomonas]MDH6354990.1 demethylmenaquinone methyltransferase/2-methoxy-6-polyprenyl-1,4-benzoquinol methylase [Dysgonomonas sp. PH5-45]MDH6387886.1 demethylmenaquinone methyltransferase/2-methoxy-6-polyprenyl-1,4-benzoquinol methylase [Dysgonomonas sp. PH5-37]
MTYKAEKIVPYGNSDENKGTQVERMFDSIAENYDTLNHTLSMGIDRGWRKKGILALKEKNPQNILDIATGTGDLAIQAYALLHPQQIVGIDISEGMMNVGRQKVEALGLSSKISFQKKDCMALDIADNSFDAAMVAFGVRNFENLDKGIGEILRVLKPGGQLMILELSTPRHFPMKQGYWMYSKLFIPTIGRLISKDKIAYRYLPASIEAFVQGKEMVDVLTKNGFRNARCKTYTFGICSMYIGEK